MGDGIEQVGFAKAGLAVDKQGVVALAGVVGYCPGGRMGKLIGGAHHEPLEGVLLCPREEIIFLGGLLVLIQLPLGEHSHLKFGGEQLPQGILDLGDVPGGNDIPLEPGGGVEDEAVILQSHGSGVVKPGVDGGGGHLRLHEGQNLCPDVSGRIHGKTSLNKSAGGVKTAAPKYRAWP